MRVRSTRARYVRFLVLRRVFLPMAALAALAFTIPTLRPAPAEKVGAVSISVPDSSEYSVEGVNTVYDGIGRWARAVHANQVRAELERVVMERAMETPRRAMTPRSSPAVTGSCAAMAPPGFPGYIVQRESGGDPNARNASSGAMGCAQILPSHFTSGGCRGKSYAECWAYLWADGRGASNWACTPESGCG